MPGITAATKIRVTQVNKKYICHFWYMLNYLQISAVSYLPEFITLRISTSLRSYGTIAQVRYDEILKRTETELLLKSNRNRLRLTE